MGGPEVRDLGRALDEIAVAAGKGDIEHLVTVYEKHKMSRMIGKPIVRFRLSEDSPVFDTLHKTAEVIRRSEAIGVAIYLPLNPIFRDPEATRSRPDLRIDDAYVRALGKKVLAIYSEHGFHTADRIDALAADAFVDLVHANVKGSLLFSDETAEIIAEAVRKSSVE